MCSKKLLALTGDRRSLPGAGANILQADAVDLRLMFNLLFAPILDCCLELVPTARQMLRSVQESATSPEDVQLQTLLTFHYLVHISVYIVDTVLGGIWIHL